VHEELLPSLFFYQLNQYECAAGQCVSELQKAQLQVQSLQAKIQESEANNMKLQEKLTEMECELRSLRQAAQSQERTIQGLTERQNSTMCKLQELAHRNQLTQSQSLTLGQLQGELVRVQSSLFSLGLELEASQRSLRQSQRQGDDLLRFKDRLSSDLQEELQHRGVTEKHNQDLRGALQKIRSELQTREAALKECEAEKTAVTQEKDGIIAQLERSLQDKERQLQVGSRTQRHSSKPRDALLEKLRERIKERDQALERSIDDKFHCLEEREGQVRALQLALREKERDLERLRCILSNNEETITSLDALVRSKELELEQAAEAYRNLQWLKQKSEEKETTALREKDTIIHQLQAALQARSQEMQDLTTTLVARVQAGPTGVVEELKARLALKEKLFQELLSDRTRQTDEHQAQVLDLLSTLSSKDQYLQVGSADGKKIGGGGMLSSLQIQNVFFLDFMFFFNIFFFFHFFFFFDSNSSTEKIQTLHTELDSVQALRGQLEEVLSRTRRMALALERAAKRQPEFGGGNGGD
uniref:CDK5 regulatory subunit-associated protein 2/Myomegalin coiled coil domain-containing protein n=1 Tax=Poecilia latipinna TaxID=48699 RepID=A0A3B3UCA7_9TELE